MEVNETTGITSKLFLRYICVSANTINGITCSATTVCYCITWYTAREECVGDNGEVASQLRLTRSSALLQLSVSQLSCTPTVPTSSSLRRRCPTTMTRSVAPRTARVPTPIYTTTYVSWSVFVLRRALAPQSLPTHVIITDRVSEENMRSVVSVRHFVSTLSDPTDHIVFACVWVTTIARRRLNVNVVGQDQC